MNKYLLWNRTKLFPKLKPQYGQIRCFAMWGKARARQTSSQNIGFYRIIASITAGKKLILSLSFSYCFDILVQCLELPHKNSQEHKISDVGRNLWRSSSQPYPTQSRVSYRRLFSPMTSWILNTSNDRDSITSLGDLFQCLTTCSKKKKVQKAEMSFFKSWTIPALSASSHMRAASVPQSSSWSLAGISNILAVESSMIKKM